MASCLHFLSSPWCCHVIVSHWHLSRIIMTIKNITHTGWGVSRRLEVLLCTYEDLSLNPQDPQRGRAWPKVPIILILETDLRGLLASQSDLRSEALQIQWDPVSRKKWQEVKEDTSPAPAPPQHTIKGDWKYSEPQWNFYLHTHRHPGNPNIFV